MVDVVVDPANKTIVISQGENAAEAARQAARATAAANEARAALAGVQSYDEVIAVTAAVDQLAVSITNGAIARLGTVVPFSGTINLQAPKTTMVTDVAYTLTYVNGQTYWSYLTTRFPHANLSNLVVKDAATSAVLTEGTDYVVDRKFGGMARGAAGDPRPVLVSYTASEERYDLICVDPEFQSLYAVQGGAGVRDASERLPDIGVKAGQTFIPMRLPLFYARVTAQSVELVKVWNIRDGIAREYETQFLADQRRNREAIKPFLDMIEAGQPTTWSVIGDSVTAIQNEEPSLTEPNGPYRDRATASGGTYSYLREGVIGTDLIDAIPDDFDNGDSAGATHTRFGRVWELATAALNSFAGPVRYLNWSVAGTNSDDSPRGMTDPTRMAAWADDGGDLGIILDGMNSRLVGVTLLFNRIRMLIDAKYKAGAKGVIVWGCSRPNDIGVDVENFLRVNRVLRQAALTPGWGGRTAAFIDPTLVSYGDGAGTMGIVPRDYCLANAASHPGIHQHEVEGELGRRLIFGLSSASRGPMGAGFTAPALLGGWAPVAGESQPGFRRDGLHGELKGLVRDGSGAIFNLPRDMWPPEDYNVPGNNGVIRITKAGVVSGSASPIGLDGVRYWIG